MKIIYTTIATRLQQDRAVCLGVELQTAVDSANAYDGYENTWTFYVEEVDDLFWRLVAKGSRTVLFFICVFGHEMSG